MEANSQKERSYTSSAGLEGGHVDLPLPEYVDTHTIRNKHLAFADDRRRNETDMEYNRVSKTENEIEFTRNSMACKANQASNKSHAFKTNSNLRMDSNNRNLRN